MSPEMDMLSRKERRKQQRSKHKPMATGNHSKQKSPLLMNNDTKRKHRKNPENFQVKPSKKARTKKVQSSDDQHSNDKSDPYAHLDSATAAALRRDDAEIAELEKKMGLSSGGSKEKSRLNKEYAKLEGYGDDFGDFLDDIDNLVKRVVVGKTSSDGDSHEEEDDEEEYYRKRLIAMQEDGSDEEDVLQTYWNDEEDFDDEPDEEIVPMKEGAYDNDDEKQLAYEKDVVREDDDGESSSCSDSEEKRERSQSSNQSKENAFDGSDDSDGDKNDHDRDEEVDEEHASNDHSGNENGTDSESLGSEDEVKEVPRNKTLADREKKSTYRPAQGEDIYGNPINKEGCDSSPKKYVPPHLRKKQQQQQDQEASGDQEDEKKKEEDETRRKSIRRSLNNALNRLSEDTLISVAQQVAELYRENPTSIVNDCIWKNMEVVCLDRPHLMTGLIPVYVACIAGVHIQMGDRAQVGEYVLEMTVIELWKEIKKNANGSNSAGARLDDESPIVSKNASNLMLVLCYLYNYGVVHCSMLYSIVRQFIHDFREIEVELLLLILSHCGRALRSDDPSALKEIVILVQKRALEVTKGTNASLSSRVDYMVSAMMDLKNNKRRQKDSAYEDKVAKIRKLLGRIKSTVASTFGSSVDSPSLRIGLDDILNVESKGRWWKVGASWVGNQYRFAEDGEADGASQSHTDKDLEQTADAKEDKKLLKLAAKARMNTDAKRAIFCIIMKGADFEDAFEKLARAGYLKNRKERDTVRVLMECCGNEKTYNPFYAHLASRMFEFQPQCKFSMQLAYWDIFKQFDDDSFSVRKAANLAKLLFHLVVVVPAIKLSVLKVIDMATPEDLTEAAMIFLTIFLSNVLEYFDDASDCARFFESEVKKVRSSTKKGEFDPTRLNSGLDDEDIDHMEDDEGLGPSLSIFLLQTMKASPKYKKGSRFKSNLKAAVKACDTDNFF